MDIRVPNTSVGVNQLPGAAINYGDGTFSLFHRNALGTEKNIVASNTVNGLQSVTRSLINRSDEWKSEVLPDTSRYFKIIFKVDIALLLNEEIVVRIIDADLSLVTSQWTCTVKLQQPKTIYN